MTSGNKQYLRIVGGVIGVVAMLSIVGPGRWVTNKDSEVSFTRTFGVINDDISGGGLHYVPPFAKSEQVSISFSTDDYVYDAQADGGFDFTTINATTKDGVVISVPVSSTWTLNVDNLLLVKRKFPGYYTERQVSITRSAVRDAISQFGFKDQSISNRAAVEKAIRDAIIARTTTFYQQAGFGDQSDKIIIQGAVGVRGLYPTDEIAKANEELVTASLKQQAAAARTQVPTGRSVDDYTKVMKAQAVAKAAEDGKAGVTIVATDQPATAVVVAGGKK